MGPNASKGKKKAPDSHPVLSLKLVSDDAYSAVELSAATESMAVVSTTTTVESTAGVSTVTWVSCVVQETPMTTINAKRMERIQLVELIVLALHQDV